jgi:type IV secretory pathway TrbF-like protein
VWAVALLVLAVAQIGIPLVFSLRITTAPDHAHNILAVAFGVPIMCLVVFGSPWVGVQSKSVPLTAEIPQCQRVDSPARASANLHSLMRCAEVKA